MKKLLNYLEIGTNRLECLKNNKEGSFRRKGKNDQTSWTKLLLNATERVDLIHRMEVLKAWVVKEKQNRDGEFFTFPDWYSFV